MALALDCPACGAEIIVKFVAKGESAQCRSCGQTVLVPADAREGTAPQDHLVIPPPAEQTAEIEQKEVSIEEAAQELPLEFLQRGGTNLTGVKPHNPKHFKWMGAFFSAAAPLILMGVNWGRLGAPKPEARLSPVGGAVCHPRDRATHSRGYACSR